MGFADKLKRLTQKAKAAAAEHPDQIQHAVEKAGTVADRRTGGKYHDRIARAGTKVETYVEDLKPEAAHPGQEQPRADAPVRGEASETPRRGAADGQTPPAAR